MERGVGIVPDEVFVDASKIRGERGAVRFHSLLQRVISRAINERSVLPSRIMFTLCNPSYGDFLMNTKNLHVLEKELREKSLVPLHFGILERTLSLELTSERRRRKRKRIEMTFYEHRKDSPDVRLQRILKEELEAVLKERF